MISHAAEYALRAIVCLAGRPGRSMTLREIADNAGLRVPYLGKILCMLVRAGILDSQRGVQGGFTLRRPATDITLLELVRVADPAHGRGNLSPDGFAHAQLRALVRRLDEARSLAEAALARRTVADVLADAV